MNIETWGMGTRLREAARLIAGEEELLRSHGIDHLVLLPVVTTRDGVHINGTDIKLEECLTNVGAGSLVVGYGLSEEFVSLAESRAGRVLDLALDGEFTAENAVISAHGAVAYLMEKYGKAPMHMKIGIIGYGRIGAELCRIILFLGGEIRVFTRRREILRELNENGISASPLEDIAERAADADIIFNTSEIQLDGIYDALWANCAGKLAAPADETAEQKTNGKAEQNGEKTDKAQRPCREFCVGEEKCTVAFRLQNLPILEKKSIPHIIDLASGVLFSEGKNITKLASIPEKILGYSGGRVYFNSIIRFLKG